MEIGRDPLLPGSGQINRFRLSQLRTGSFIRSACSNFLLPAFAPAIALLPHLLVLVRKLLEFVIGQVLDVNHLVLRLIDRLDDLIELEMDRAGIAILRVLSRLESQTRENVVLSQQRPLFL